MVTLLLSVPYKYLGIEGFKARNTKASTSKGSKRATSSSTKSSSYL
jgi:hypothetical protein